MLVLLRPLLRSTSSLLLRMWIDCPAGGSLLTSGAAGMPDGPIHHTGGGGGGGRERDVVLVVDFIGSVFK